ncbi:MAG: response regulator, partial [Bdellovibrionales bacterium]|nr:response regulator [Bdellovibrionales bacterium]
SYNSNFDEGVHPLFEKNAHRKVLIVEDNPTNQIVAQSMLSQLGATPTVAADGKEALELALKSKYDLILMDCQMPIMNGFEATAKLREGLVTTPIIAMTANVSKENERLCLTAGMNDFLPKPITINALRTVLTKYMQASPAASNDALDKLKQSIGDKATAKVVSIFISSLSDFKFTFESCIGNQNIEDLNRLGHKYKSSALTVGAYRFSELCKQLEQTKSIEEVMQMRDEITELLEDTSGMLASTPSEIIKFV